MSGAGNDAAQRPGGTGSPPPLGGGRLCSAEHAGFLVTPLRRFVHDPRRVLAGLARPGDTVIDVGCGPGYFTLPLAEMVGVGGRVVAVDLQPAMLEQVRVRAARAGLAERIEPHPCTADGLGDLPIADAMLAFAVVHELPDVARFCGAAAAALRHGGRLLLVEPRGHVSAAAFAATLDLAAAAGLRRVATPRVRLSRAALLERV
jgi:SAM-dependent methyltransferase